MPLSCSPSSSSSSSSSSVLFLFPLCSLFVCSHTRFFCFFLREMTRRTDRIKEEHPDLLAGPVRLWVYISSHSLNQSERSKGKTSRAGSDDRDQLFKLTRSPNATWIPALMVMMMMVVVMKMMLAAPKKLLLRFGGFFDALLSLCWSLKLH